MNWLKEGYKEGQHMYLVTTMLYSEDIGYDVIVKKVTRQSITVVTDLNDKHALTFKQRVLPKRISFGNYILYDCKEDYDKEIEQKKHHKEMLEFIKNNIDKLSIDKLEEIKNKYFEKKILESEK